MNSKLAQRWQEIDELLAFLAEKDRAWLARERTAASGAPPRALSSVARSGPATFAALAGLSRDVDPEAWVCSAILVLREAEKEFVRAGLNDPDSFGSAIFGQVAGELSQLFARWTQRNPEWRYDAERLRVEVLESFDGRLAYWWECFVTPYMSYDAPEESVQAAFRELTKPDLLPSPLPSEPALDYLMRVRTHFQTFAAAADRTLAEVAAMAVEDVDRVLNPVTEVVAKPRLSSATETPDDELQGSVKFRLFEEVEAPDSPWWHQFLRGAVLLSICVLAAWISGILVSAPPM